MWWQYTEMIAIEYKHSRNIYLDIVRILSATLILITHVNQKANINKFHFGNIVYLFFILSGYLVATSAANTSSTKEFFLKRFARIIPTYYVGLLVLYCSNWVIDYAETNSKRHAFRDVCGFKFLRYVFGLQLVIPDNNYWKWCNDGDLWSISSFFVFYMVLPIIITVLKNFKRMASATVVLVICTPTIQFLIYNLLLSRDYLEESAWLFSRQFPFCKLYAFMLGTTLYFAIKEGKETVYTIILVSGYILTFVFQFPINTELLFTLLLIICLKMPQISIKNDTCIKIKSVSEMSFCLYVIHPIVIKCIVKGMELNEMPFAFSTLSSMLFALFLTVCSLLFTSFVYIFIVRPIEKKMFGK